MDSFSSLDIEQEQVYPTPYASSPLLPLLLLSLSSQRHSPITARKFLDEYDYIVVGAGSAGSAVAARLSEEPCVTVLLLEAGKPPPRLTEVPAIARSFINTDLDWQFFTTPQRHSGNGIVDRRIPWPSGKSLGGSSILNAMIYIRGNRRNYDEWAERGAKGWSYEDVLPYFKKLEDNTDRRYLKTKYHAAGGPITASRPNFNPVKKRALVRAIKNEGFRFVDPNAKEQNGFYDLQASIRRGQRCSTAKGYLVPAESRPNFDILPNAMVRKVLIENNRTTGAEFDFKESTHQVKARREVILTAGTTNTAQLLMLSGIGPRSELEKFDIPVIADLPVGLYFQDHQATLLIYEVDNNLPTFDQSVSKDENIEDYIELRRGALTSTEGLLLASFLSNSGNGMDGLPDNSVYFMDGLQIGLLQSGVRQNIIQEYFLPLANSSVINCIVQPLRPRSVGTVTIQSADPYDPPLIDPNYYADDRDTDDVVEGMKYCQRIMSNRFMRRIGAKPVERLFPGCEEFAGDEDLYFRCIALSFIYTTNHQVGTAKMGDPSDPSTVVDPQLRVKGIEGLRVADCSIMPTIPWSNTNIPAIMVGEKAADIIKSTIQCNK